jgi:hypothetical protein
MPVSGWARVEQRPADSEKAPAKEEYLQLLSGLRIPPHVAAIGYPRGCRIRRVRVRALDEPGAPPAPAKKPVIVSKKALQQSRHRGAGR